MEKWNIVPDVQKVILKVSMGLKQCFILGTKYIITKIITSPLKNLTPLMRLTRNVLLVFDLIKAIALTSVCGNTILYVNKKPI